MRKILLALFAMTITIFVACTPEEETQKWTITVQSADNTMGYTLGAGVYDNNTTAHIVAVPNNGYKFVMWSDSNTANPREVIVTKDTTFTAYFNIDSNNSYLCVVTVKAQSDSIYLPDGTAEYVRFGDVEGGGTLRFGTAVEIRAIGKSLILGNTYNAQSRFSHWSDGDTHSVRQIAVTGDCEYTAYFEIGPRVIFDIDDASMFGKWGNIGRYSGSFTGEYFRFDADHTGETWDLTDDIAEGEGIPFTWQITDGYKIAMVFVTEMGQHIPREYIIIQMRMNPNYCTAITDSYEIISWQKVSQ